MSKSSEYAAEIAEFLEETEKFEEREQDVHPEAQPTSLAPVKKKDDQPSNELTQYTHGRFGYTAIGNTNKILPAGVYSFDMYDGSIFFKKQTIQTDALLRLPDSKSEQVIKEIQNFWKLYKEFSDGNDDAVGGYLHKRGYIFWGPPGSGKTCTIKIIMDEIIKRNGIVFLADCHPGIVGKALQVFRKLETSRPCVIILEDIDALIERYSELDFLSVLDGEATINNALFIATTNYPSKLDPRIFNRPGRFSDVIKIGMPNKAARKMFLELKLKNKKDIEYIVENTEGFSLDHLKSLILGVYFEKRPLNEELARLKKLFNRPHEDEDKRMGL